MPIRFMTAGESHGPAVTAILCVVLFFYAGAVAEFLAPLVTP